MSSLNTSQNIIFQKFSNKNRPNALSYNESKHNILAFGGQGQLFIFHLSEISPKN
jgi:hypothetical protein